MTRRSQHYPRELRERAVRMVAEVTPNYESQWAAIGSPQGVAGRKPAQVPQQQQAPHRRT
jgi:hypothetical protein